MNNSYEIGFEHGAAGNSTNGYKPANRKDDSLNQYQSGFQDGISSHHVATLPMRTELAALNLPKSERL